MSKLNRQIIATLNQDGRVTNKDIAQQLDVSEGTVRNRIIKLLDSGQLKVTCLIHPDASPSKQLVLLGLNVAVSKDLNNKADEISRLEGVQSVHITTGCYDIILEAWLDAKFGLIKFLSEILSTVEGITSTESFLALKTINKWIPQNDI